MSFESFRRGLGLFANRVLPDREVLGDCTEMLATNGEVMLIPGFMMMGSVSGDISSYWPVIAFLTICLLYYQIAKCIRNEDPSPSRITEYGALTL